MESRKITIGYKTNEQYEKFMKDIAQRYYNGNTSLTGHNILKFAHDNQSDFIKWIKSEREKMENKSLLEG